MPNNGAGCAVEANGKVDVAEVVVPKPVMGLPNNPPGIELADWDTPNVLGCPKPWEKLLII